MLTKMLMELQTSHSAGTRVVQDSISRVFSHFGISSPPIDLDACTADGFFDCLEASLEVLGGCAKIWGELNVKIASQALLTSVCRMLPSGASIG